VRIAREIISVFVILIIAYLVLIHSTGFAADIGSLGSAGASLAKTFQGR
jgi:hypothetical protein